MTTDHREYSRPASDGPSATRRGLLKTQLKALVAIGATVFTTRLANAEPGHGHWSWHGGEHEHGHEGGHGNENRQGQGSANGPACFLRGTRLRTANGECKVEDVALGDRLLTASGRYRSVQWVGSWQARRQSRESWSHDVRPVRIKKSALAPNVPYEDLYVTRGHAIFIDDVLVPAGELVNGTSIVLHDANETDELEYFHVKLASHDVIFAAGAPSETLLSDPNSALDLANIGTVQRESYCAPVLCNGTRKKLFSRARRLATPFLGPQKLDIIRQRLAGQIGRS